MGASNSMVDPRITSFGSNIPYMSPVFTRRYLQPAIPGFFNMGNAALKWLAYTYVAASIAEMLISGSELVLSVIAARFLRKRMVSGQRWCGKRRHHLYIIDHSLS